MSFIVLTIGGIMGVIALLLFGIAIAVAIGNPVAGFAVAWLIWECWKWTKPKAPQEVQPRAVDRRSQLPSAMDD